MEILDFGAWFQNFLLIISGFLVLFLLLLVYTNKYIANKVNQIEQKEDSGEPFTEFQQRN
ncbi:hypothetical protein [Neobacillus mesonae]|uniref:Uncharacterized protein n=1 Tax=Neobacillus mesonae TaxID=1193713 RepID=A0A3Q9QVE5_9BACI|nr:hypothetical protein [Neobacillus mesonae]AZU62659.1 hypothetical protein CHR53_16075 [Neobacillus mesonae]MED4205933.1 hypothetical protein [Neobacillus mesonae]